MNIDRKKRWACRATILKRYGTGASLPMIMDGA